MKRVFALILAFFTAFSLFSRTIRVGIYNKGSFQSFENSFDESIEDTEPTGYLIELLAKLSEYTGWNYDFVKCRSIEKCKYLLDEQLIDIMAMPLCTHDSNSKLIYSSTQIATDAQAIYTKSDKYPIAFEDFTNFSSYQFGLIKNEEANNHFFEYTKNNKFSPKIYYYDSKKNLTEALNKSLIDCAVMSPFYADKNMKLIGFFDICPIFLAANKNNFELSQKLNQALLYLNNDNPDFIKNLSIKYTGSFYTSPFTQEEQKFARSLPILKVGYTGSYPPVSYTNPISGNYEGIIKTLLDFIAKDSNLKFTYIEIPKKTIKETEKFIEENNIILFPQINNNYFAFEQHNLYSTIPFMSAKKVFVGTKYNPFLPNAKYRIATIESSADTDEFLKNKYPNCTIKDFRTVEESLDALLSGKADFAFQNQLIAENYISRHKYKHLFIVSHETIEENVKLTFLQNNKVFKSDAEYKLLLSILNKAIRHINKSELSNIIIKNYIANQNRTTIRNIIIQNWKQITVIFVLVVFGITMIIINTVQKLKNFAAIQKSKTHIQAITDNINGGVITLKQIDNVIKIIYLNKGFLTMIQYPESELKSFLNLDFCYFVHPDDIDVFTEIFTIFNSSKEHISIKCRLKCRDDSYINTIINGTFINDPKGNSEIYCVLMDISYQERLLLQLQQKQTRYKLFLEKSHDMYFDINIVTGEVYKSALINQVFGYLMPGEYKGIDFFAQWKIYSEDYHIFTDAVSSVFDNIKNEEIKLRLICDNNPIWCKLSLMPVCEKQKLIQIIGRIEDIDTEEKERKAIIHKTQIDSLTGLYRKETFIELAQKYLDQPHQKKSALIFLDLDNFKAVNDNLGHLAGDNALIDIAGKLQLIFSNFDIISRFGGDEFCILLKEIPISTLKEKLLWTIEKLSGTYGDNYIKIKVSASIGVALSPDYGTNVTMLMQCADKALYHSKKSGKNTFTIYSSDIEE